MNDDELFIAWADLEPTVQGRRRMDAQVAAALEAHGTSLTAEWLALFALGPWRAIGLVAVSVVSLVTTAPLPWIARVLW